MRFIKRSEVPADKTITYANMVCDYRPLKEEKFRSRLTIGGDKLPYDDETASPAADLLETKIFLNSTISDAHKGARFMGIDRTGGAPTVRRPRGTIRMVPSSVGTSSVYKPLTSIVPI